MKKTFLKPIALLLAVIFIMSMPTSCSKKGEADEGNNVFTAKIEVEEGKLTCSPVKAYYSDGSNDKDTGAVSAEGSLLVNVGIANGLEFPKTIRALTLALFDESDNPLAQETTYDLQAPQTIKPGEIGEVQCVFSVETVLKKIKLETIKSTATLYYVGCVLDGAEPKETKDTVTAAIEEANFVSSVNFELSGKIKIKNNKDHMVTPQEIRFWVKTPEGKKLHNTEILIANDVALKAGETITLPFTITASDAAEKIEKFADFDYLKADYDIKIKE